MALTLSRIDRIYRKITVTAVLPSGGPATLTGADIALLPVRGTPTAATVWTATSYAAGVATVLLAGPDADPTSAVVVPTDCDLWLRVTDSPEVEAVFIERLTVKGSASLAALPQTLDQAVAALLANRTSATYAQAVALPTYPNGA